MLVSPRDPEREGPPPRPDHVPPGPPLQAAHHQPVCRRAVPRRPQVLRQLPLLVLLRAAVALRRGRRRVAPFFTRIADRLAQDPHQAAAVCRRHV